MRHQRLVAAGAAVVTVLGLMAAAGPATAAPTASQDFPLHVAYLAGPNATGAYDFTSAKVYPYQFGPTDGAPRTDRIAQQQVLSADKQYLFVLGGGHQANDTRDRIDIVETDINADISYDNIAPGLSGMAVSSDMHLYLSSPVTDTVYAIDLYGGSGAPTPITGITDCWALAVSPDGHRLYAPSVAADGSGELTQVDTQTLKVTARLPLPQAANNITSAPDGSRLYLTTADSVLVWDTASSKVVAQIPVTGTPSYAQLSPNGRRLYVATSQAVVVIDTTTGTVAATVPDPDQPSTVSVTADGASVYVSTKNGDHVEILDSTTLTLHDSALPDSTSVLLADLDTVKGSILQMSLRADVSGTVYVNNYGTMAGFFPITSYSYDYGDHTPTTTATQHVYAIAGTYPVTMTVTDTSGRTASITQLVLVAPVRKFLSFLASNGRYFSDPSANRPVVNGGPPKSGAAITKIAGVASITANSTERALIEVIPVGGDRVVLRSYCCDYIRTVAKLGGQLIADTQDFYAATVYQWIANSDETFSLRDTTTGRYVSSNDGYRPVTADRTSVGPTEKFRQFDYYSGAPILNGALSSVTSSPQDSAAKDSPQSAGVPRKASVITGWATPNLPPAAR